ncbi:hypothetical protein [Blastomonas fulva]|uniref:hypothetical protein n=1 Tax=Blastomonas fulva TaxID=1550728 RepID=UPI00403339A9
MVALVAGCTSPEDTDIEKLKEKLRDPYSAQFEEVYHVDGITCGLVNSKNLMGAYTGHQIFVVQMHMVTIGKDVGVLYPELPKACSDKTLLRSLSAAAE